MEDQPLFKIWTSSMSGGIPPKVPKPEDIVMYIYYQVEKELATGRLTPAYTFSSANNALKNRYLLR